MGYKLGMPCLKLNNVGKKSRHCGSFKSVAEEALMERNGRDPDIDTSRTYLNEYGGYESAAQLIAYSERHISEMSQELKKNGKREIRTDAVVMMAGIFKPPMEYTEKLSDDELKRLFIDCLMKLQEIVGDDNIKSWAIHFDELNPHMHVFWEPITEDARMCAKETCNLNFFSRLNKEMPIYLRNHGWNEIDDCKAYDAETEKKKSVNLKTKEMREKRKRNGRDSRQFKFEQEQQVAKLDIAIEEKNEELDKLEDIADNVIKERERLMYGYYEDGVFHNGLITLEKDLESTIEKVKKEKENYLIINKKSEELKAKYREMNEEYENVKRECHNLIYKNSNLDKQIREKQNWLEQMLKTVIYLVWNIFDKFFDGVKTALIFGSNSEDITLAEYTLNKARTEAMEDGMKLPEDVKREVDRSIEVMGEMVEEKLKDRKI